MTRPYIYLERSFHLMRATSISQASQLLVAETPDLVLCSASPPAEYILAFLERIKTHSTKYLIPLIMVVDLNQKVSQILGTTWGGQIGILTSLASPAEIHSTLKRIVQHREMDQQ